MHENYYHLKTASEIEERLHGGLNLLENISEKEENVLMINKWKLSPPVHLRLLQHGSQNHGGGTTATNRQTDKGKVAHTQITSFEGRIGGTKGHCVKLNKPDLNT